MSTALINIRIPGVARTRKMGLLSLVAVLAFAIAFGTLIPPPGTAHAGSNEPWLYLECLEDTVDEGDDFRLQVRKKYKSHSPHETMRVFWYTEAITADDTDYEYMYAVRQASNRHQSESGKMGRTFHTLEDLYPEIDETYLVRFNNSVDHGTDGECYITIKDDDGVGIYDLEIRSVPGEIPVDQDGQEFQTAYTAGDDILITAKFNHPVTTKNPETGEQTDYAGLHLNIGENRRVANVVRGDGTDTLIFGYTVQAEDVDANGISVEDGWAGTGFYYNEETSDSGLWPVNPGDGRLNRIFHGLSDDPDHPVAQVDVEEPTITPVEPPTDGETPIDIPILGEWVERSVNLEPNLLGRVEGELTEEDEGRDWYGFEAVAGEDYFIELWSAMDLRGNTDEEGFSTLYVENHLVDPSILEIVDEQGVQVMGEVDQGGFINNWGRAHFTPLNDGTYYIAVGAGSQDRSLLGRYTLSVRADDYADDTRTVRDVTLRPGDSITARIDSDVSPNDPGLSPWDWWQTSGDHAQPLRGLESLDDRDFFRFEIAEAGDYALLVSDAPHSVGIWATWFGDGHIRQEAEPDPVEATINYYEPGTYLVEIGTPWRSAGNTGLYTVSLLQVQEEGDTSDS